MALDGIANRRLQVVGGHLMNASFRVAETTSVRVNMTSGQGSPLTTHVLDTSRGVPAAGLRLSLYKQTNDQWKLISNGMTNSDGRCPGLLTQETFVPAVYKLRFETADYFATHNIAGFYPYVEITFLITNPALHYHVPLILSPFSYSTYRGS